MCALPLEPLARRFLKTVPEVRAAFGYGSGVFVQPRLYGHPRKGGPTPQLDFVFVVDDTRLWHEENLRRNGHHYSGAAVFGPGWVDFVANRIGNGVHFNAFVQFENKVLKYGITSVAALKEDLMSWRYLFLSGRLHKPVLWIQECEDLREQLRSNALAAMATALLVSPESLTKRDLFRRICGLSYSGDIRMGIAEDRNKIERIVDGSFDAFDALYCKLLDCEMRAFVQREEAEIVQVEGAKRGLLEFLPESVQAELSKEAASLCGYRERLLPILSKRVASSSRRQVLAGFCSTGLLTSLTYMSHKFRKAVRAS